MMERAREIGRSPGFGAEVLWLTFYLSSGVAELGTLAHHLQALDAVNLDDGGDGFLYPKIPVTNDPSAIVACVEQVLDLASASRVHVLSVDVDATPKVGSSTFMELARFEPDRG
jgi:hypothetical protein